MSILRCCYYETLPSLCKMLQLSLLSAQKYSVAED